MLWFGPLLEEKVLEFSFLFGLGLGLGLGCRVLWGCQNLSAAKRSGFEVSPGLEGWGSERGTGTENREPRGQ